MPGCWDYSRKTFPYKTLGYYFIGTLFAINIGNTVYSLAFEDYCKRSSSIYDIKKRNSHVLRKLISQTNDNEKKTIKGKSNTTFSD